MNPDCSCLELDADAADSCVVCVFFACMGCTYPREGYCRRHAPTTVQVTTEWGSTTTHWPMVARSSWCGDFQRRPPKVGSHGTQPLSEASGSAPSAAQEKTSIPATVKESQ